jgi:multidrug efflux pump subunit AcrB
MIDTHKGIIAWFARNSVAANLLMSVIIITGLYSAFNMRTQVSPDSELDRVNVDIIYPGASPAEVEKSVLLRVEEAVREIEGIDDMRSWTVEGFGSVSLDLETGYDIQEFMDEVKLAVDRISSFPDQIEKPRIYKNQRQHGAIRVQVYGDLDEKPMKMLSEQIRDEIQALPSVTIAQIDGARDYEISIELKEAKLRQYGLTLEQVAQAVRNSSLDLPAGSIKTNTGDILLRTQGQAYQQRDFEQIVLLSRTDGTRLTLGDIAVVDDGFVEIDFYSLFDNKTSVGISVTAVGEQNQIDISAEVREYVEHKKQVLPAGIYIESWLDSTYYLNDTLEMMLQNLAFGVVLVFVVLSIFLRIQLAFWVMIGLPICFLGAFALMPLVGASINMISMFGFILVLGIVVDDAIIIGESAQTYSENEGQSTESVIRGARRVAIPATFGVLTTIAAFGPMLLVPGSFGAFPMAIAWVVILCLAFSIVESKLILPAHLAHMASLKAVSHPSEMGPIRRFQTRFASGLAYVTVSLYEPFLALAIRHRYTTLAFFISMLVFSVGILFSPYVKTVLFPNMPADFIRAQVELVDGAPSEHTVKIVKALMDGLQEVNRRMPEEDRFLKHSAAIANGTFGTVMAEVTKGEDRQVSTEVIAQKWRAEVGEIAGTKKLQIQGSMTPHGHADLDFRLLGKNPEQLKAASTLLENKLKTYTGVYDIENSSRSGSQEINLKIRPSAEALGLTLSDLARQVRAAFYGVEAQRIQRDRDEIKVMVRYPREERQSIGNLESMFIRTPLGDEVPFTSVAEINLQQSYSKLIRTNGKRMVEVTANAQKDIVQPGKIVDEILNQGFADELRSRYPSVSIELGGGSRMEEELLSQLLYTAGMALFVIYALMAVPLRSYLQPVIIMGVIPFGMIGALVGHMVVGLPFSALSLFGIVALAGVVVNDSIIMVDFINKSAEEGIDIISGALKAGTARFRAIMLTSLTTFFGLLPMLLERSLTAQFVIPMAVSLGFGILFSTVITLLLIPCLYVILDDLHLSRFMTSKTEATVPLAE